MSEGATKVAVVRCPGGLLPSPREQASPRWQMALSSQTDPGQPARPEQAGRVPVCQRVADRQYPLL